MKLILHFLCRLHILSFVSKHNSPRKKSCLLACLVRVVVAPLALFTELEGKDKDPVIIRKGPNRSSMTRRDIQNEIPLHQTQVNAYIQNHNSLSSSMDHEHVGPLKVSSSSISSTTFSGERILAASFSSLLFRKSFFFISIVVMIPDIIGL